VSPDKAHKRISEYESGRFEKGSLAQKLFEPLATAKKLENGSLFYKVEEKEVAKDMDEDKLRKQFERARSAEPLEFGEEEQDELRVALLDELADQKLNLDDLNSYLDQELSIFKNGEQYSYVKDLKEGFKEGIETPTSVKILRTIPDHVFWDIKKPFADDEEVVINTHNPAREYPGVSFFDIRNTEEWLYAAELKENLNPTISKHRKY